MSGMSVHVVHRLFFVLLKQSNVKTWHFTIFATSDFQISAQNYFQIYKLSHSDSISIWFQFVRCCIQMNCIFRIVARSLFPIFKLFISDFIAVSCQIFMLSENDLISGLQNSPPDLFKFSQIRFGLWHLWNCHIFRCWICLNYKFKTPHEVMYYHSCEIVFCWWR